MVVFIELAVSFTIINDAPSLTIVNNDSSLMKRRGVLKKISRSFSAPKTVNLHIRRHSIKLQVIFFKNVSFLNSLLTIADCFYKNYSFQKRSLFVFLKFKTSGLFLKTIFSKNETIVFENDRKTKQKNDRLTIFFRND